MNRELGKAVVFILVAFAAAQAQAISHHYRHQLQASGCTQVQEANGECGTTHKVPAAELGLIRTSVMGQYLGNAAEVLEGKGFTPVEADLFANGKTYIKLTIRDGRVIDFTVF